LGRCWWRRGDGRDEKLEGKRKTKTGKGREENALTTKIIGIYEKATFQNRANP